MLRSFLRSHFVYPAMIAQAFLFGCHADSGRHADEVGQSGTHELLNAVLWVQTAAEYEAICEQTFALAGTKLIESFEDPTWTAAVEQETGFEDLSPAVIVDVDETVLGNSQFDARLAAEGIDYDQDLWGAWVRQAGALPLPGAQRFIDLAQANGVEVFFVTNRGPSSEEKTLANLRDAFRLDISEEHVLCRGEKPEWGSDKSTRRSYLAQTHRILLLLGDDLNDFVSLGNAPPEERMALVRDHRHRWGSEWIIFPNPIYGGWERALYGYDDNLNRPEKLRLKHDALDVQK
jgi:5'-nucleotidase (lipoprotein e(P4) family)